MNTKKGWNQELMLSLYKKEATYDAGVTMNNTNACSMNGFEVAVPWDPKVENDKGEVTGKEHGYDQEIISTSLKLTYKETKAKPNSLAGLAALVMGNIVSTQDGALTAYKHKITPTAIGSELPSIQAEFKKGGIQCAHKGIKGSSIKIAGEAGGFVSLDVEMLGSGARATSATPFVNKITESWLKPSDCKVWMEDGSDISISAGLVQDAEDISSATPADLKARMKSFEWGWENKPDGYPGFGGAGVLQDIDYVRRAASLKFTMLFSDDTELNHFINQNPLAIEFDIKGALIAATGTMYYGFQLIVPRFKLKKVPEPIGGVNDILTVEMDCEVFDDGINAASILEVYNAQAAYLAA